MPSIAIVVAVIPTPDVPQIHGEGSAIGVVIVADQRAIVIGDVGEPIAVPFVIKVTARGRPRTELGDTAQAVILEGIGGEAPAEILGQRGEMVGGRLPMPVVLQIPDDVGVQIGEVPSGGGQLHAAAPAVGIPIADEACPEPNRRIKDVEAGGGVPVFAHQPVGAVLVGVIAVALRGMTPDDASGRIIVQRCRHAVRGGECCQPLRAPLPRSTITREKE